jgi:3-phosphoshikimate 1-carboxyvinyltransferase
VIHVPGSKSITNRALVAAGLATGPSVLRGALVADDTMAMVEGWRRLGAVVDVDGDVMRVTGTGGRLRPGPVALDARQAGTVARFLLPVVALGHGPYTIDGDPQLRRRPMGPGIEAVRRLGAEVRGEALPVTVVAPPAAWADRVPVPGDVSSQFLSGLLLVGPMLPHGLTVEVTSPLVSRPYVALTAAVMRAFGAPVEGTRVEPGGYVATEFAVEPDASAASYLFAAAVITGRPVAVAGLSTASLQGDVAFVRLLADMGARVSEGGGGIEVAPGERLAGIDVDMADLSDTAPTLAVVAALADSPTRVRGIGFIRAKETDRIGAVVRELRRCGVDAGEEPDGFVVRPGGSGGGLRPATVVTDGDHRMAMAFSLLSLVEPGITVDDPGCVAKTFPGWFAVLDGLRR